MIKPKNIRDIAPELNIGRRTSVFPLLDDNPAERELVRQQLPMVIPEVGNDPALYPDIVLSGGFELYL